MAVKNFNLLKFGIEFFNYSDKNIDFIKTEIGEVPKRASFFDKLKSVLSVLIAIGLFFGVIKKYLDLLGTEKS